MVGVLMSDKTLNGIPNSYPNEFPLIHDVSSIFLSDQRVLNLIHYNTHQRDELHGQLAQAKIFGGPNCHGFQLNIDWPNVSYLEKFRKRYPKLVIVQQLSAKVMADTPPAAMAQRLSGEYANLIDHVLLDGSGGFGKPLDLGLCESYLDAFMRIRLHRKLGIGIAGGLCADELARIAPLVRAYPRLNIDAQGKLRTADATALDISKCTDYLLAAAEMY